MRAPLERIDLEGIKQQFDAYWRREAPGGPFVAVTCRRTDAEPPDLPVPETVEERWTRTEYLCNRARWQAENNVYLGVAFPMFLPDIGPDSFSAYLGAELQFLDDATSWVRPCVDRLADYTPVFDRANKWWRHMCELLDALCEVAPGNFLIGVPDLHGGGDALAALRHPDKLALDLYDVPEEVERLMVVLTGIYKQIVDEYSARISRRARPRGCRLTPAGSTRPSRTISRA